MTLTFRFDILPVGKGRPRLAKTGHAYTPAKTRGYEDIIARLSREQYEGDPLTIPLSLGAVFTFATTERKKWGLVKDTRPDLDNLVKAVTDPLNGIVWKDDAQIFSITATKVYGSQSSVVLSLTPSIDRIVWHNDAPLVSQKVIDASDKFRLECLAEAASDPKLLQKFKDTMREAKEAIDRCANEVISGEEYLRGKET